MELQQLRYVVALADTLNFSRAAERCHVVQSALSHQIKALETELGTPLFARTSRRVELTEAGQAFLPHAHRVLETVEQAAAAAVIDQTSLRGSLTIGLIPTVTAVNLPELLSTFSRKHPLVKVRLRDGGSHALLGAVHSGELDAAFIGVPSAAPPPKTSYLELKRDRHVAVVHRDHPLARKRRVTLESLTDELFADFPMNTSGRDQSDLAFESLGLSRNVVFETSRSELICAFVEQQLCVALLSRDLIIESNELVALELVDGPERVEYLVWSDFNPSATATALRALVEI